MAEEAQLQFDWNASNSGHLARHKITRAEFEEAMANKPVYVDFNDEAGEERWYALGATNRLRVLFLVLTFRDGRIRPITGWDAGKKLQKAYFEKKSE
jgi:uncharacterized protein